MKTDNLTTTKMDQHKIEKSEKYIEKCDKLIDRLKQANKQIRDKSKTR
jgi:transcription initiation factor IIF auxiliary subunit